MARLLLFLSAFVTFFAASSAAPAASAASSDATWYMLNFYAPKGGEFIGFFGVMTVPTLPHAGTYYLWPGLQPTDNSGVYQEVLDGKKDTWWVGTGWYNETNKMHATKWGDGFNVWKDDPVAFNKTLDGSEWHSSMHRRVPTKQDPNGVEISNNFDLGDLSFNRALFAIELYGQKWDFGPLVFSDIKIVARGSDKSWCTSKPAPDGEKFKWTISGVTTTVGDGTVTCNIEKLSMIGPV